MKPCADKKEAIAMLAMDALTAPEAAALHAHLHQCAACSAYAVQFGAMCDQLGKSMAAAQTVEPPPGFHARLKHRIQSEQQTVAPSSFLESLLALLSPARCISVTAILALAFVGAFWFGADRKGTLNPEVPRAGSPAQPRNDVGSDPVKASTLMAYQSAFNRSYEDLDALVSQNARRNSTPDGMTLIGGTTSF
jgi:anti-sigma factor RsiW